MLFRRLVDGVGKDATGKDARHSVLEVLDFLAPFRAVKAKISPRSQSLSLEDQLIGIEAKTAPYPAALGKRCQAFSA